MSTTQSIDPASVVDKQSEIMEKKAAKEGKKQALISRDRKYWDSLEFFKQQELQRAAEAAKP